MGAGMLTFGFAASTLPIAFAALAMGGGLGYTIVVMTTWLQQRTPEHLMGRTMSLLVLAVVGVIPISMMLVGVTLAFSTQAPFLGAGVLILHRGRLGGLTPTLRRVRRWTARPCRRCRAISAGWRVTTVRWARLAPRARARQGAATQAPRLSRRGLAWSGATVTGRLAAGPAMDPLHVSMAPVPASSSEA